MTDKKTENDRIHDPDVRNALVAGDVPRTTSLSGMSRRIPNTSANNTARTCDSLRWQAAKFPWRILNYRTV